MAARHPEEALVPFLRGELSAGERDRVGRHLAECAQCRDSADSFAALLERLPRRLEELPTPDWKTYRAELRRKLAAREESRGWHMGPIWASLAASVVAATVAVWLLILPHQRNALPMEQLAVEQPIDTTDVGLLQNYAVVERLDLLENYDVIEHLDEITPPAENHGSPS